VINEVGDRNEWKFGVPGAIRTPDPQLRRLLLYPAELRVQFIHRQYVDIATKSILDNFLEIKKNF
jgi:hypothetical protein